MLPEPGLMRLGDAGVYDRLAKLSIAYQHQRLDIETDQRTRMIVRALCRLFEGRWGEHHSFTTAQLTEHVNLLAREDEVIGPNDAYMNTREVGHALGRLRVQRARSHNKA